MNEYDGGDRHKVTEAIDLLKLREEGSCTFEIEGDGENAVEEDIEKLQHEEQMQSNKDFFGNISLKNLPLVECATETTGMDFDELATKMTEVLEFPGSGILKKVKRPGRDSAKIPPGAKVFISYMAYLDMADEPFDKPTGYHPFSFKMGAGKVIAGLEMAVSTMYRKEISQFLVPPEFAYGPLGCPPRIPAAAKILFHIEVVDFEEGSQILQIFDMSPEERAELPFEEVFKAAEELKSSGKRLFKLEDYQEAVAKYSRAAKLLEEYYLTTEEQEKQKNATLYKLFNNLAMCYFQLDKPRKCINSSKTALKLPTDQKKDKPYYWMGRAEKYLGNMEAAKKYVEEANRISAHNPSTLKLLSEIISEMEDEKSVQTNLYKKMMAMNMNGTTE